MTDKNALSGVIDPSYETVAVAADVKDGKRVTPLARGEVGAGVEGADFVKVL